ncbi:MAG TPA: phosphatase PAP2 family protein [Candidatus Obscuribacterales bacterium]
MYDVFQQVQAIDLSALWWLRSYHSPVAVWAAWAVSTLAWKGWLWWLVIIGCWLRGRRDVSAHLAGAILIATVAGLPLKSLIARARPDLYASQQLNIPMAELLSTAHSFPSGHTLLAAAFAFVIFRYWKDYRGWLAFAFVALVGIARVYQAMHWPSDVVGSIALGALAAYAAGYLLKWPLLQRLISRQPACASAAASKPEPALSAVGSAKKSD